MLCVGRHIHDREKSSSQPEPEQDPKEQRSASKRLFAPAFDVYSLGVLTAVIFNRQQPYSGLTQSDILVGVLSSHLRPKLPACLSSEVGAVCENTYMLRPLEVGVVYCIDLIVTVTTMTTCQVPDTTSKRTLF